MSAYNAAQCLALVERSPKAVAAHDKAGWLAIFAEYNIVEDPVGSRPHISGIYDKYYSYNIINQMAMGFVQHSCWNSINGYFM